MNLTDETTHPVVLLSFLTRHYGPEWMEWEPAVLRLTLEKEFHVNPARAVVNKALAVGALATRDEFWQSYEVFHFITQALGGHTPVMDEMQAHPLGEMMIAVWVAKHVREELKELSHVPFYEPEVARYVAAQVKTAGVWFLEDTPLAFAHSLVAGRWYHCNDCKHDFEVVFEDGLCDFCTDRWNPERLGPWKPGAVPLKQGWGKNITYFEKNPSESVRVRLAEIRAGKGAPLSENATDICVARLLAAAASLEENMAQMKNGLTALEHAA